jgi:hypothetical protein
MRFKKAGRLADLSLVTGDKDVKVLFITSISRSSEKTLLARISRIRAALI